MKFLILLIVVAISLVLVLNHEINTVNQNKVVNIPPDTPQTGVLSKEDWEKFKDKTKEIIKSTKESIEEKLRKDPEIKCETEISFRNGKYYLRILGWNHGSIAYSKEIEGDFEKIKNDKLEEIKKCEKIIYSETLEKLKELK